MVVKYNNFMIKIFSWYFSVTWGSTVMLSKKDEDLPKFISYFFKDFS